MQLLESPVFVLLRLQLLDAAQPFQPALLKSLYGERNRLACLLACFRSVSLVCPNPATHPGNSIPTAIFHLPPPTTVPFIDRRPPHDPPPVHCLPHPQRPPRHRLHAQPDAPLRGRHGRGTCVVLRLGRRLKKKVFGVPGPAIHLPHTHARSRTAHAARVLQGRHGQQGTGEGERVAHGDIQGRPGSPRRGAGEQAAAPLLARAAGPGKGGDGGRRRGVQLRQTDLGLNEWVCNRGFKNQIEVCIY